MPSASQADLPAACCRRLQNGMYRMPIAATHAAVSAAIAIHSTDTAAQPADAADGSPWQPGLRLRQQPTSMQLPPASALDVIAEVAAAAAAQLPRSAVAVSAEHAAEALEAVLAAVDVPVTGRELAARWRAQLPDGAAAAASADGDDDLFADQVRKMSAALDESQCIIAAQTFLCGLVSHPLHLVGASFPLWCQKQCISSSSSCLLPTACPAGRNGAAQQPCRRCAAVVRRHAAGAAVCSRAAGRGFLEGQPQRHSRGPGPWCGDCAAGSSGTRSARGRRHHQCRCSCTRWRGQRQHHCSCSRRRRQQRQRRCPATLQASAAGAAAGLKFVTRCCSRYATALICLL